VREAINAGDVFAPSQRNPFIIPGYIELIWVATRLVARNENREGVVMQIPLELSFHNMDQSDAVEANVRERAAKLERYFDRIIGCRVVVEAPHKHSRKGKIYEVRIDISVPGKEIVVNRNGPKNHAHEDIYVAIRDAFNAAGRQLEDHARKVRGEIKNHGA